MISLHFNVSRKLKYVRDVKLLLLSATGKQDEGEELALVLYGRPITEK
jgi:hypothetical protein